MYLQSDGVQSIISTPFNVELVDPAAVLLSQAEHAKKKQWYKLCNLTRHLQ